jgi:hypothetical protein
MYKMRNWDNRAKEIAHSLNPAFCARLLYGTINSYIADGNRSFPFPLIYLVLPLLLHRKTCEAISSKTQFINWIHSNDHLLIDFAERAKSLVPITNEALEFLLQSGYIIFSTNAELDICHTLIGLNKSKLAEDDVKMCILKSEHIGRWFIKTGRIETIYSALGVRP